MCAKPFYKDHTSYGATLGMTLPMLVALFLFIKREDINTRFLMILLIALVLFATVVSYTRATWVSILASVGIWAIIKLKIRFEIRAGGYSHPGGPFLFSPDTADGSAGTEPGGIFRRVYRACSIHVKYLHRPVKPRTDQPLELCGQNVEGPALVWFWTRNLPV